jgi:hypothetical protein
MLLLHRFVLVASAFGRTLAREIMTQGADFLLAPDGKSVTKPLLKAASKPLLTHWLEKVSQCPRLLPLEEKVFIVVNDDHYPLYERWAMQEGFPKQNLINNGAALSYVQRPRRVPRPC